MVVEDCATLEFSGVNIMKHSFTFHLLGLPHLPTSKHYASCAFTQKNIKLCKMLADLAVNDPKAFAAIVEAVK